MNKYILIVIWVVVALFTSSLRAEESQKQKYLNILPELPLMEGLEEVPESSLSFDKPDGRIAEATYFSDTVTADAVLAYYEETLPQLGWSPEAESMFLREQDQLVIRSTQEEEEAIIVFSLSPVKN